MFKVNYSALDFEPLFLSPPFLSAANKIWATFSISTRPRHNAVTRACWHFHHIYIEGGTPTLFLSLSLSFCISLFLSFCISLSLSLSYCISLLLSVSLSLFLYLTLSFFLYLSLFLCLSLFFCVSPSFCIFLSWGVFLENHSNGCPDLKS